MRWSSATGATPEGVTEARRDYTRVGTEVSASYPIQLTADSLAAGLRCVYRCVMLRSECRISSWIAFGEAPSRCAPNGEGKARNLVE